MSGFNTGSGVMSHLHRHYVCHCYVSNAGETLLFCWKSSSRFFFVTEGMGIAVTKQPIASSDRKSQALALSCMTSKLKAKFLEKKCVENFIKLWLPISGVSCAWLSGYSTKRHRTLEKIEKKKAR